MLAFEIAIEFEVPGEALDHLQTDVVESGAAINELGAGGGGNEILGGFLISVPDRDPLIAGKMPGGPGLSAFVFAADPVAEDLALVGIRE